MRLAVAQFNPVVGDIDGNLSKAESALSLCKGLSSDLLVLPELFLVGYPPRDLLKKPWFIERISAAVLQLEELSGKYPETGILVGAPTPTKRDAGRGLYNSALLIHQGKTIFRQHKSLLPTYDVFDEARYFDPAPEVQTVRFKDEVLGVSICEDAWNDPELWPSPLYFSDPIQQLADKGASLFINISASPFHLGKDEIRFRIISNHAKKHKTAFVFVNQVGANDELIFDGRSMCFDAEGNLARILPPFEESLAAIDTESPGTPGPFTPQQNIENVYNALLLGIQDYVDKCGFSMVVVGLSGGIDSAVVCALAARAIGSDNVLAVSMPSPYTSSESTDLAGRLAENLGVKLKEIPVSGIYDSYIQSLKDHLRAGDDINITLENIQARIRGNILMALSNEYGHLVLSTGNKSELAVGYCTLYGDMTGGLAVISDVPKTMVYELANYINRQAEVIPSEIITRPPSAELRPDQKDQDTLPPYDILDKILHYYIDERYSVQRIVELGFDAETVRWVIKAVHASEYKRRQATPGLKVTSKAFGMGRRMPIAAKFEV